MYFYCNLMKLIVIFLIFIYLDGKEYACNVGDLGWIPGSGRSHGEGNATHSSILAWITPWTEELGGLQSLVWQGVRHD